MFLFRGRGGKGTSYSGPAWTCAGRACSLRTRWLCISCLGRVVCWSFPRLARGIPFFLLVTVLSCYVFYIGAFRLVRIRVGVFASWLCVRPLQGSVFRGLFAAAAATLRRARRRRAMGHLYMGRLHSCGFPRADLGVVRSSGPFMKVVFLWLFHRVLSINVFLCRSGGRVLYLLVSFYGVAVRLSTYRRIRVWRFVIFLWVPYVSFPPWAGQLCFFFN